VSAYGSRKVQVLLEQWAEQARKIEAADELIRRVEQARNPSPDLDQEANREHRMIPEYREAMQKASAALYDQMRRELRGKA
jgi:hypothetical protein